MGSESMSMETPEQAARRQLAKDLAPKAQWHLSPSSMDTFMRCQRKYYLSRVRRLKSPKRNVAAEFGSAWHKAMEAWWETKDVAKASEAFEAMFADDPADRKRTRATARRMLTLYDAKYREVEINTIATEQKIVLPFGQPYFVMRLDRIVEQGGTLAVLDHKTTGSASGITAMTIRGYKPNMQFVAYAHGASKLMAQPIRRVMVDLAWVSPTEPKTGERFLRMEEPVEEWEIEEVLSVIGKSMVQVGLMRQADDLPPFDVWKPNWGACQDFGGCPFAAICHAAPGIRERIIEAEYTVDDREESW